MVNNKMKITKNDIIIFAIIFIITLIVFNGFLTMHYATDTYNIINRGYEAYAIYYSLNDGRPIMSIITLLANIIHMPINTYIILLTFLAILVSCISVILLKKIISNYKKTISIWNEILLTIICYVTIFNFMFLENMQFAECFVMSVSILIYIIAANILIERKKNYLIKTYLLIIIGIFFYQGTLSVLVVMTTVLSLITTNIKTTYKNILLAGIRGNYSLCN